MIFKSDIIEAINDLSNDLTALSIRVYDLERQAKCSCTDIPVKRSKGRPRKDTQPRDKSGKFAKK